MDMTEQTVQGATVNFGTSSEDQEAQEIQKEKLALFLGNVIKACEKHGFSITATEHEGMLISNDEIEGYIWSIYSVKEQED